MFKRKRTSSSLPFANDPVPSSPPLSYLQSFQHQAQSQVDNAKAKILPDLLTKLSSDICSCESTLYNIRYIPVCPKNMPDGQHQSMEQLPLQSLSHSVSFDSSDLQSFLALHQTFSRWSVNPEFITDPSPCTTKDILLGIQTPCILEAAKSLIFLKITCSVNSDSNNLCHSVNQERNIEQLKALNGYIPQNLKTIQDEFEAYYSELGNSLIKVLDKGRNIKINTNIWAVPNAQKSFEEGIDGENNEIDLSIASHCIRDSVYALAKLMGLRTLYIELLQILSTQISD